MRASVISASAPGCGRLPEDSRPEIYLEATDRIDKINDELNKLSRDRTFQAEQAYKFGKRQEAKDIFRVLMLTFPNKDDPRHQKARAAYVQLGGSLQEIE